MRPSASVTKSLTSLGKFPEDDEKDISLSIISSDMDREDLNSTSIKNQVKHLVTSPTTPKEWVNREDRTYKSLDVDKETLVLPNDFSSLTRDEELVTEQIDTFKTYNKILLNKEVQVYIHGHDDSTQTDEMNEPNNTQLVKTKQLVTCVDLEPKADFENENIINSLKKDTRNMKKNRGTMTKDNKQDLVSKLSMFLSYFTVIDLIHSLTEGSTGI